MNGVYGEAIDQYVPEGVVLTEIQQGFQAPEEEQKYRKRY